MSLADVFANIPSLGINAGIRKGRVPCDGYKRGWGLQFGELAQAVESDRLFQKCMSTSTIGSIVDQRKRYNLHLLLTQFLPRLQHRNVIEFGSFKGGNAIFMALVMREICPDAKVFALDTYEGMPTTDKSIDAHNTNDFSEAHLPALKREIDRLKLTNLVPLKGLFQDTFPTIDIGVKFGLAHIDADIYSSVKYAQDAVWPRMTAGGYVAYDDADVSSCIGATEAVEDLIIERQAHAEQVWPHFVFRVGL
ncbi:Macrocin-O-methyltransferase (TylF) [Afipia felis]|uniref:Macrocin-O-methyltransferase (TylF) n=2 Tax=Afipia felis TaxID=1035 RepID=A0A380W802_AFIFE|nr:hypothetical protein HMPREF9697_00842 [Afipia felis ATCC 53690]SUU77023.1 Macrocin-O-methyltransferase (TylF) [Afipia felis]SUU85090.1 Macrocin-O-methyltransferase (TylF) [Afipia felis]